ncbi:MAG: hypothetical protein RL885_18960 [Planctomycetota bacterium]
MVRRLVLALLASALLSACCDCDDDDDKFYWSFNSDNGSGSGSGSFSFDEPAAEELCAIRLSEVFGLERRSARLTLTLALPPGREIETETLGAFLSNREILSQMRRAGPSGDWLELDLELDLAAHGQTTISIRPGRRLPVSRPWSSVPGVLADDRAGVEIASANPLRRARWWSGDAQVQSRASVGSYRPRLQPITSGALRRAVRITESLGRARELHLDWHGNVIRTRSDAKTPLERLPRGIRVAILGAEAVRGTAPEVLWDLTRVERP